MGATEEQKVDYLAQNGIPQLVDGLVCNLLDHKPEDPVAFLHAALTRLEAPNTNILIFGPNGSGKGTQASMLKSKYAGIAHIESGAIFREHIGNGTALGKEAKTYIDRGDLVPDDITIPMILETLKAKGSKGWLLDGFPRSIEQAQKLWDALQKEGLAVSHVVEILLDREVAKHRIMGRRLCANDPNHPNHLYIDAIKPNGDKCRICGGALSSRADDQDEGAIAKRHDIYYCAQKGTLAAAYFFRDLSAKGHTDYISLDGSGDIGTVKAKLAEALKL